MTQKSSSDPGHLFAFTVLATDPMARRHQHPGSSAPRAHESRAGVVPREKADAQAHRHYALSALTNSGRLRRRRATRVGVE